MTFSDSGAETDGLAVAGLVVGATAAVVVFEDPEAARSLELDVDFVLSLGFVSAGTGGGEGLFVSRGLSSLSASSLGRLAEASSDFAASSFLGMSTSASFSSPGGMEGGKVEGGAGGGDAGSVGARLAALSSSLRFWEMGLSTESSGISTCSAGAGVGL